MGYCNDYIDFSTFQPFLRFYDVQEAARREGDPGVSTLLEILHVHATLAGAPSKYDYAVSTLLEILQLAWSVVVGF